MFLNRIPRGCRLHFCEECDFYFFNVRPSDDEIENFYAGYRDSEYQLQRQRYESFYTKHFNDTLGCSENELTARRKILEEVLLRNGVSLCTDILDYGGHGSLFPNALTGHKYCFDLTKGKCNPSVQNIDKIELNKRTFEIITMQHLLEHLPNPMNLLMDVAHKLLPCSGYLYLELPNEVCAVKEFIRNSGLFISFKKHIKISKPKILDALIPDIEGPYFHEHINYFTLGSFKKMVIQAGLRVVEAEYADIDEDGFQAKILYCLACKTL
jgi:SAM-dependent methyltransferase